MQLSVIAQALNATLHGDGTLEMTRVVHPGESEGAGDLAIAMEKGLLDLLAGGKAVAAVVAEGAEIPADAGLKGWIAVKRPRVAMNGLLNLYNKPVFAEPGVHPTAWVHPTAKLGDGVSVGPFVAVGPDAVIGSGTILQSHVGIGRGTVLGNDCLIHAGTQIGERVEIGARCIVQANAVIGADGFSFVTPEPGSVETAKATGVVSATNTSILRTNSIGTVILGDDVEVGACTTIDRGTLTATRIGSGTKIDNAVQIGHNVQIGTNCLLCGHVGVAGSTEIGDRVVLGGKVGVADHVKIGNDVLVAGSSSVGVDIPPRSIWMGYPAIPKSDFFEQIKNLRRLKRVIADVAMLKKAFKTGDTQESDNDA